MGYRQLWIWVQTYGAHDPGVYHQYHVPKATHIGKLYAFQNKPRSIKANQQVKPKNITLTDDFDHTIGGLGWDEC